MRPAIRVENLSKCYRIGGPKRAGRNLSEVVGDAARSAWSKVRRLADSTAAEAGTQEFWALKDVSFEVAEGEVVGIIGRNGAGKSTLLKILSRIVEPTSGGAEIHGRLGSLLEVGTGFNPELTGRENVYLNGSILGMKKREIDKKFDEIVAFSEVEQFLDTPVKRYSSGMYVRLAFAVAAHLEPEVLIVDEVLAVGDAAFQKKCLEKVGEIGRHGITVLVVSHSADMIAAVCQTGFYFVEGKLQYSGTIRDALTAYYGVHRQSTDGIYDLTYHDARSRLHENLIHKVILRDSTGKSNPHHISNMPFIVEIHLSTKRHIRDARLAIAIEDPQSRRLFTVASFFSSREPIVISGVAVANCTIPTLRLGKGTYLLSVSISTREEGLLDSIDGGIQFDVDSRNVYGNGESYSQVYGPILEDSVWTLM